MFLKKHLQPKIFSFLRFSFGVTADGLSTSSKDPLYDKYRTFHNIALENLKIPGITIVRSESDALRVINILKTVKNRYKFLFFSFLFLINKGSCLGHGNHRS